MVVYKCDLCEAQKKIDGKYYDICQECWTPLEAKLKGKEASGARSVLLGRFNAVFERQREPRQIRSDLYLR
jgi:hypothetical protein